MTPEATRGAPWVVLTPTIICATWMGVVVILVNWIAPRQPNPGDQPAAEDLAHTLEQIDREIANKRQELTAECAKQQLTDEDCAYILDDLLSDLTDKRKRVKGEAAMAPR